MAMVSVQGRIAKASWESLLSFTRQLSEFTPVAISPGRVITAELEAGLIRIEGPPAPAPASAAPGASGQGIGEALVQLRAVNDSNLQNLRDTLAYMLDTTEEAMSARLTWFDAGGLEGRLSPNFRLARVQDSQRISPQFQRIRLEAEDLGYLSHTGLHLRLMQPRDPADPQWPRLAANGRTLWPAADLLHKPVYTTRAINICEGWLEVDVYLHGRGPTCAWAKSVRPGDTVGLNGPGGGWKPATPRLCLGGDETALPVIARILAEAGPEVCGQAVIELGDPADRQDLRAPAGVAIEWLQRGKDQPLAGRFGDVTAAQLEADPATGVLFGGEKADAAALRARLRGALPRLPADVTLAAYWSKTGEV